jgi:hypothetical protein
MPHWNAAANGETLALGIRALHAWSNEKPPADVAARPEIVRRIREIVQSALHAAAWPRWLLLERTFLDGSATGDLLFAVLALRAMCEEVQRLHALDLNADQLASMAASSMTAGQERLKLFLLVAWTSLDSLPRNMVLEGVDWPSLKLMGTAMPELEKARAALNSYVHPNYGSHIAALFPERTAAARLLLEAMVAAYEAFFALSWAERPVIGKSIPTDISALEAWPHTVERFLSLTLPDTQRKAENPVMAEVLRVPAVISWLTTDRANLEDEFRGLAAEPLLEDLPRRPVNALADSKAWTEFRMWDGALAIDVLDLAGARRAEQLLAEEFPSGAPDTTDQSRWLRFNALSLQLAMLLDRTKAAALKTQLIRQITQGNSLGVQLCARSLIEHRALAIWLPQTVETSLSALAREVRARSSLPQNADEVSKPLVNFLAARAGGSKEERRSWVIHERGGVRTAWLNLNKIVESAFPEDDPFRTLYALASAAMHGRNARGWQIAIDPEKWAMQARFIGLLILERLCNRDEEMDHLGRALRQFIQLDHAADFGGASAAVTHVMAQQAFGLIDVALVPGIDYTGEGTAESPFRLGSHLQIHQASRALLDQLGINVASCPRVPDRSVSGSLCDRWRAPERDYWFQIPIMGSGK